MCGVFHTFAIKTVEVRFVCLCIYFHFSLIKSLLIIPPFQYGLTKYMFRWIYFTKKTFYLFWDANTCSYLKYVNITCCSLKQNVVFRWGARCPISINNGMSKQRPSVIHIYTQHISTFDRGQCIKGMRRKCFLTNDFLKSHMLLAMFWRSFLSWRIRIYLFYLFHLNHSGTIDNRILPVMKVYLHDVIILHLKFYCRRILFFFLNWK